MKKHRLDPRRGIVSLVNKNTPVVRSTRGPKQSTAVNIEQLVETAVSAVSKQLIVELRKLLVLQHLPTSSSASRILETPDIQLDESVIDVGLVPSPQLKKGQESANIATTQEEPDAKLSTSKRKLKKLKGK
jgi:hypothetical protein